MISLAHQPVLGKGSFGSVYLVQQPGREPMAVKAIKKSSSQKIDDLRREIEAGKKLTHKNIVKLLGTHEDEHFWYLMMEHIPGQNLFEFIETLMAQNNNELNLSHNFIKKVLKQIVSAMDYAHKNGVTHLDLKLENIMIYEKTVKIIDFGLCEISGDVTIRCTRFAGSMDYLAPEVLRRRAYRGDKADVWSLGTILFAMFYGEMPFNREERQEFLNSKEREHPDIKWDPKKKVPKQAQELIASMLAVDPADRPTMSQIKNHSWLSIFSL